MLLPAISKALELRPIPDRPLSPLLLDPRLKLDDDTVKPTEAQQSAAPSCSCPPLSIYPQTCLKKEKYTSLPLFSRLVRIELEAATPNLNMTHDLAPPRKSVELEDPGAKELGTQALSLDCTYEVTSDCPCSRVQRRALL